MAYFQNPFTFNPFPQDLTDAEEALYQDPGAFTNYLFRRGGRNQSAFQMGSNSQMGNFITSVMPALLAAQGKQPHEVVGANEFGKLLQSYIQPRTMTPFGGGAKGSQSFTGNVLNSMRSLAGQGTGGTDSDAQTAQQSYLSEPDAVLRDIQAVLAKRMGSYLSQRLFNNTALSNLRTKFLMAQNTKGNQAPDIIQFLQQQGIL